MPRQFGQKLINRKDLNRNMKRAGCVSTVGRPVMIASNKRCCCDSKTVWCLVNKKAVLKSKIDCDALVVVTVDTIFATISAMTWTVNGDTNQATIYTYNNVSYVIAANNGPFLYIDEEVVATVQFSEPLSQAPILDDDPTNFSTPITGVLDTTDTTGRSYKFTFDVTGTQYIDIISSYSFTGGNNTNIDATGVVELIVDNVRPQFTITATENTQDPNVFIQIDDNEPTTEPVVAGDTIRFTFTLNDSAWSQTRKAANPELMDEPLAISDFILLPLWGPWNLSNVSLSGTNKNGPFQVDYVVVSADMQLIAQGQTAGASISLPAAKRQSLSGVDNLESSTFTVLLQ